MERDTPMNAARTDRLLSIVMPVHNGSRWLRQALESTAHACATLDAEIIVIDDGSSDDSLRIATDTARRFSATSFTMLQNATNRGIVHALNRGLDQANGRFIARMDADDICLPQRFSTQLQYLRDHELDACGSWFIEFGRGLPRTVRWPHHPAALRASMLFQNSICHPTLLARREVFDRFRYREAYRLAEDYDLLARALEGSRMANVPQALLKYRRHPAQATMARRSEMERVTRRIRIEALSAAGIQATAEQQRLHNLIRAPQSIRSLADLDGIEQWLEQLHDHFDTDEARRVVASQWIRACIRAAPLGRAMWQRFRASPLHHASGAGRLAGVDLKLLSVSRIDYASPLFAILRRLGLSA